MRQEVVKIYVGATSGAFGVPTWLPRFLNNTFEVNSQKQSTMAMIHVTHS